jgi:hypothetical protein
MQSKDDEVVVPCQASCVVRPRIARSQTPNMAEQYVSLSTCHFAIFLFAARGSPDTKM